MRFRTPIVLTLCLLSACAANKPDPRFRDPTLEEWQAADFGEEPDNYDRTIRQYLLALLQDPNSTNLTVKDGPKKTWIGTAPDFQFGYGMCMDVTEHGVYDTTNFGPAFFLLHNDHILAMREGSEGERLCDRLGRIPLGAEN